MSRYRIENLKDITDSKEILQSSPKGFSKYMTYIILLLLIAVVFWSVFAEKEVSIQASGVVRPSTQTNNLSSNIQGTITEIKIKDGDEVKSGDVLIVVDGTQYEVQRDLLTQTLEKRNKEKELNNKLKESVSEGVNKFDETVEEEKSYSEKYKLYASNSSSGNSQSTLNDTQKAEINKKITDLQLLKKGIEQNTNYFKEGDTLYYQYNNYVLEIQKLDSSIKACQDSINKLESQKTTGTTDSIGTVGNTGTSGSDNSATTGTTDTNESSDSTTGVADSTGTASTSGTTDSTTQSLNIESRINTTAQNNNDEINQQISTLKASIQTYTSEKTKVKNSTIMNITSQIEQYKTSLSQLQTGISNTVGTYKEQYLVNIENTLATLESTIDEIEMNLETINLQIEERSIKANLDGVVNMVTNISVGDSVQVGSTIASIIPKDQLSFNIEVAIPSNSFGEIKDGQQTSIELVSLPGSQYGYINSSLENISVSTKINQQDGTSYYTATCAISEKSLSNKSGESVEIKNGMLANVRIINRKVTYFKYFLEKIDISN